MWTSFVILPWHAAAVVGIYILAFFVSWTKDKTLIMRDASLPGKSKASLTSNRRTWTFFWNDFWSLDKQSAWRQIFVRFSEHYITVHRDAIIVDIVILAWIWKQPRKASHRSMSQEFQLLVPNRKIDKCLWTRLRHCNQTWNVHATIISNLYANAALRYFTSKRLPRRRASDQLNMFYMKLAVHGPWLLSWRACGHALEKGSQVAIEPSRVVTLFRIRLYTCLCGRDYHQMRWFGKATIHVSHCSYSLFQLF